jgi:hypothetical protein
MAIKYTKLDDTPNKGQKVEHKKQSVLKKEKKNAAISATMSGERPKVTLPKFSWDK